MDFEETHAEEEIAPVFKMADLTRLDVNDAGDHANCTRLKNRLLDALPEPSAHTEGKYILLTFSEDVGGALKKACMLTMILNHLARAAQFVGNEMF